MNLNENLAKSLDSIDALADDVLAKSKEAEDAKKEEEVAKGLKPDDVSSEEDKAPEDKKGDKAPKGKKEDDSKEDDSKEDDSKEDDSKEDDSKGEDTKKSITETFAENETIAKSLEVSDFLAEFTRVNSDVLDELRSDINKSLETSTHTATILAKSFNAIMKSQEGLTDLVKSQASQLTEAHDLIKSLQSRIEEVEKQPAVRKSVVTPLEKSFDHSAGLANAGEKAELSKSEKLAKLTNMAMNGQNDVTVNDVVSFESTGKLRPELEQYL